MFSLAHLLSSFSLHHLVRSCVDGRGRLACGAYLPLHSSLPHTNALSAELRRAAAAVQHHSSGKLPPLPSNVILLYFFTFLPTLELTLFTTRPSRITSAVARWNPPRAAPKYEGLGVFEPNLPRNCTPCFNTFSFYYCIWNDAHVVIACAS